MKFLILSALFLAGCTSGSSSEKKTYMIFGNGYEFKCSGHLHGYCGVTLYDCEDGNQYECLNNVVDVK